MIVKRCVLCEDFFGPKLINELSVILLLFENALH
jgi:hypothetical protein